MAAISDEFMRDILGKSKPYTLLMLTDWQVPEFCGSILDSAPRIEGLTGAPLSAVR